MGLGAIQVLCGAVSFHGKSITKVFVSTLFALRGGGCVSNVQWGNVMWPLVVRLGLELKVDHNNFLSLIDDCS